MSLSSTPPRSYRELRRPRRRAAAGSILSGVSGVALTVALAIGVIGTTFGTFRSTALSSGNDFTAATDFVAPTAARSVIAKSIGGTPGYIRQGGTYHVYGEVTDSGNPASGILTVTSDTTSITTSASATSLASGSFSIGGLSYNRRTASLTANASLAAGTYNYSLTMTDVAANARTTGFTVVVDNTAPAASDVQTANGGSIVGRAQQNDSITFTFSEPIDPQSILSGWDGSATNVVARLVNPLLGANDTMTIFNSANSAQLPFGSVDLGRNDYIGGLFADTITFGDTGTASSMTMSGNQVTIVFGTASATAATAGGNGTMVWTPTTTPYDRAGNAMGAATATESGAGDKEF